MNPTITIDKQVIEITHPDKIIFPDDQITKEGMITYYQKIAPYFIPHATNRCMVMRRYPEGITHEGFFQKEVPDYFPSWIKRAEISLKSGGDQRLVVIKKAADLVYLANQGVLEFHTWLSPITKPHYPNKIVFDLDPDGNDLTQLHMIARALQEILEGYGLIPFLMTTGSRGYHIVAPIKPTHSFDVIHEFTKNIAVQLAHEFPKICTTEMSLSERKKRIFIDYLRNSYGQTSVAPYSLRARNGAPIATPLVWKELSASTPQKYHLGNIFRRLAATEDPWKNFEKSARILKI